MWVQPAALHPLHHRLTQHCAISRSRAPCRRVHQCSARQGLCSCRFPGAGCRSPCRQTPWGYQARVRPHTSPGSQDKRLLVRRRRIHPHQHVHPRSLDFLDGHQAGIQSLPLESPSWSSKASTLLCLRLAGQGTTAEVYMCRRVGSFEGPLQALSWGTELGTQAPRPGFW